MTQYTVSWCLFHFFCLYDARRGLVKSSSCGEVGLLGFASVFDRLAKAKTSVFNGYISVFVSEVSCSLSSYSVSRRNSDPWVRIVFVNRFNSHYHSIFALQVASKLWLPTRVQFWCSPESNLLVQMSFHLLAKCTRDMSLVLYNARTRSVMKYCPTSTVVQNPASVTNFITRSWCGSFSTRSLYFCNNFLVQEFQLKVWVSLSKFAGSNTGVRLSYQHGFLRSCLTSTVFLTHIWDCSVDTEMINRDKCAKKFQSYPHRHGSVSIIFHLCFWAFLGTVDSWFGKLDVRVLWIWSSSIQRLCPILLVVCYHK